MMGLLARTKIYLKFSMYYAIGILLAIGVGFLVSFYDNGFGALTWFLMSVGLYIKLHIDINKKLASEFSMKKLFVLFPILLIAVALMVFKISVNESINFQRACIGGLSESTRYWHYLVFGLWSSILLWEVYYRILSFVFHKKEI